MGCTHPDYGDFFLATFDARLSAQPHLPNETASLGTLLRWVRARVGARQACGGAPRRCRAAALARAPQGCRLGLLGQHCPATLDVLTAAHCLKLSSRCRYGFQPHRVALWIYWHAVLLLWKGVPFFGWVGPRCWRRIAALPAFLRCMPAVSAARSADGTPSAAMGITASASCASKARRQAHPRSIPTFSQPARPRVQVGSGGQGAAPKNGRRAQLCVAGRSGLAMECQPGTVAGPKALHHLPAVCQEAKVAEPSVKCCALPYQPAITVEPAVAATGWLLMSREFVRCVLCGESVYTFLTCSSLFNFSSFASK